MDKIAKTIAEELNIKIQQVENTIKLIDEGNTIPFIARYRKEVTGGLSDEVLRTFGERLSYLRNLETRKGEIIKSIDEQGKLTDELTIAIASAETLAEVEDLYRPFKQKKKTRATVAKAKGLEPLAKIIIEQKEVKPIEEVAKEYVITNIDFEVAKDYVPYAVEFNTDDLLTASLPGINTNKNTSGTWVFIHDKKATQALIQELFYDRDNTEELTENAETTTNNVTSNTSTNSTINNTVTSNKKVILK